MSSLLSLRRKREQEQADAETARQQALEDQDAKNKQEFAKIALQHQLTASETKQQTAQQFNESYWDNGIAAGIGDQLTQQQANIQKWLSPDYIYALNDTGIKKANAALTEIQQRKQLIAKSQPHDFDTFHDPANANPAIFAPLQNTFSPGSNDYSDTYTGELAKKAAPKGSDDKWYGHHEVTRQEKLADNADKVTQGQIDATNTSLQSFRTAKGELATYLNPAGTDYDAKKTKTASGIKELPEFTKAKLAADKATGELSANIANLGNIYPELSSLSNLWNANGAKYHGLSTLSDVHQFFEDESRKMDSVPEDDPEKKAYRALYNLAYGNISLPSVADTTKTSVIPNSSPTDSGTTPKEVEE